MKGFLTVAGTVVIGATNPTGKERLNLQQMAIVTPRTAEALGLSYQNLWDALVSTLPRSRVKEITPGSPILVRLSVDQRVTVPSGLVAGPLASIPMDQAILVEKNVFVRP